MIGLSADNRERTEALTEEYNLNFDFYFCDMTTLKTIVRSNPGILEIDRGTIKQKLHWNDLDELQLEKVGAPKPALEMIPEEPTMEVDTLDQGDSLSQEGNLEADVVNQ